ncbi:putative MFS family arabinose efflux permease [Prauserella shujinwangii]|uniref:Putative MFS family arabinose efflux permease n=1 Tax=Prauserella shujinwangii TaxID=1453103 RepID=A0A2T0M0V1_9PSEU|nr:MFS transporter [Prauserella shujinwangii]PRX50236.1 putative MFS family arabinose efflux permease [Prauserella shujinwangii]
MRSEPDGPRFGRLGIGRAGRKARRKWAPEQGPASPRGERTRAEHPPPPTRAYPGGAQSVPTADEAPTGAAPHPSAAGGPPPQGRGARPYPPGDPGRWRTEPLRRDRVPPPPWRDRQGGYERYDTGGYAPGQPRPEPEGDGEPTQAEHRFDGAGSARPKLPKKITVTRVAAMRGRQLTGQAVDAFHRATRADGADKSGLTSLTYAVMLNYASDAAMAIALANTLFFAASSGESRGRVALYLLITIAPFALVAPVIGPALDRVQRGRRLAMSLVSAGQALMCVLMALHFNDWGLYPAALGKMVLSKSFMVLKAAVTPRVVPPDITLSKTNARLAVFGLASAGVFGALASGVNWAVGPAGALWFTAAICLVGAVQAMRIPSWVEVTEGEVPASLTARPERKKRQPMGGHVVVALWGNGSIRVLTGFLMMFAAFAVKAQAEQDGQSPFVQLLLLGVIGAAAGAGGFVGNALGSRMHFGKPDQVILGCLSAALASTVLAALLAGIPTAAVVGLVGATASALAKNSLDAVIQHDMPEESRASAFGRSETVLQLSWVFGGAVGLLLPPTYWIGFLTVSLLLALGLGQTWLVRRGSSLVPRLGGTRPRPPGPAGAQRGPAGRPFRTGS